MSRLPPPGAAREDDRRFRQGLRLSKLSQHKTLDDYNLSFQPEIGLRKGRHLASFSFVEEKANVVLLDPGVVNGLILI
ncbi:ATP-binding protein [Streptomyces sp. NPDC005402]|uniref:ATP-binding protein n=1 Tax=Streptomyces sp. NPDC005402 TaxID=3155338 RepID=UPI0033B80586